MATDALDPGPDGTYPYLERNPDGTLNTAHHPVEPYEIKRGRDRLMVNPTPTLPVGRPITDIAPAP